MDDQQRQHLKNLRQTNERRHRILELQAASFGLSVPPHILTELEDVKERIASIDNLLLGHSTENETQQLKSLELTQTHFSDKAQFLPPENPH
jgi:hypothetical protein